MNYKYRIVTRDDNWFGIEKRVYLLFWQEIKKGNKQLLFPAIKNAEAYVYWLQDKEREFAKTRDNMSRKKRVVSYLY